jgi:hypothetical protein
MTGRSRQQRPIDHPKLWPRNLPAQDLELVTQDHQLEIFHVETTAATNAAPSKARTAR